MSDTDSDLGIIPVIMNRMKKKTPIQRFRKDVDTDEESLYESTHQKVKKMNKKKRVVLKDGFTNVTYKNISKKRRRYISDLYTTLLDSSWTYCVLMFTTSFYGSWIIFGGIYYLISFMHGDFMEDNLASSASNSSEKWIPCILETDGFAACFLFSLETQHTIGYGTRQTTTECPDAMFVMSVQAVLGCIIQAFMVGLVFSKLSRPRNRSKTIIFSNQAVITMRNKKLCLIIRIGDLRDDNFILGTQISAKLMRRRISIEGEVYQEMHNLTINPETTNESCIFFVWPLDIVHVIDEDSPFYEMSATDLAKERFELLLVLEGTNETSNMTFQARTSYLPNEILWGHRFEQMQIYRKDRNKFEINFSAFHSTYEVDTTSQSAKELDQMEKPRETKLQKVESILSAGLDNGYSASLTSPSNTGDESLTLPSISRANSNTMRRIATFT
eukprot:TRINITY_DN8645_c0_g1_i1.p1 TRINITY_DN8645_c0_g1~~TRINITY_DN8645_c0_g1_i1.p1  ORF type:complete len:457 (-),score=96.57 TRINITY_DN8645_c0_g1_i1:151-1479(-)